MQRKAWTVLSLFLCVTFLASAVFAGAPKDYGLKKGTVELKSVGPLSFGPDGILLVSDPKAAAVYAVATGDKKGKAAKLNVEGINGKIADLLGTTARDVRIVDLAVNPQSGTAYLSVTRKTQPVLLRVDSAGKLSEFSLEDVKFAKADLPDTPEDKVTGQGRRRGNKRLQSITDVGYVEGRVLVAGLSTEEFASTLRSIPFPFTKVAKGTGVKIFHGAHGRFETKSPIRTFATYKIKGEQHLLAAYICTPLVKFSVASLKPGVKLEGTTVAELGNGNRPLDMFVYSKGGKDYLLLANSRRGVMKIETEGLDSAAVKSVEGQKVPNKTGQQYETIGDLKGVQQLDKLDDGHALVLVQSDSGSQDLKTIDLP